MKKLSVRATALARAVSEKSYMCWIRAANSLVLSPASILSLSAFFRSPPAYRSLRHRFAERNCKEVKDGRGRWGGRGSVGARPTRWRRRTHARAPAADVGAPQAARRALFAEGRGSGAGLARTCGDGRRAARLAGGFPCRWRGILEEPARRCS